MNRREAERQTRQQDALRALGFTRDECEALRRISMTLQRWHELECGVDNGCVERDETTGKTYWHNSYTGKLSPFPDRETGARKRLAGIIAHRNEREALRGSKTPEPVSTYIQGDPRGAALYIIRPGDVPEGGALESYYPRGLCVY